MNNPNVAPLDLPIIPAKKADNLTYLHGNIQIIPLSKVKRHIKTQQRVELNLETVAEYKEAISLGAEFPPIKVRFDGENYWLADGFHTSKVYEELNRHEIKAEVKPGTLRDAILDSVGANSDHGLRRSRADKRKAVLTLLYDDEWMEWSNVKIAKQCHVSESLVRNVKKEIGFHSEKVIRRDRYGNQSAIETSNIGKKSNTENDDTIITSFKRSDNREEINCNINKNQANHNSINDKPIITGEKRGDKQQANTNELSNQAIVKPDKPQKAVIISTYRKGEQGTIGQKINSNQTLIEFPDGTKEVFSNHNFIIQQWNSGDPEVDKILNQASHAFSLERPMEKMGRRLLARELNIGDIVLIDPPDRVDSNLVGYTQRWAKITNLYSYSADIKIWDKEIKAVSVADLKPLRDKFVSIGVSIKPEDYAVLMDNFRDLESALIYAIDKKKQHPGFSKILNGGTN